MNLILVALHGMCMEIGDRDVFRFGVVRARLAKENVERLDDIALARVVAAHDNILPFT